MLKWFEWNHDPFFKKIFVKKLPNSKLVDYPTRSIENSRQNYSIG